MKFRILTLFLFLFIIPFSNKAQSQQRYYVTIGVFGVHNNAIRYTDYANKLNFSAQYALHPERKLYFVYLLDTDDKRKAFAFLMKIRVETEFKAAWVYIGNLGDHQAITPAETPQQQPVTEPVKEPVQQPVIEEPKPDEAPLKDSVITPPATVKDSSAVAPAETVKPDGKPFLFKLVDSKTGAEVAGEIHLYASPKATQYQSYPVNKVVYLKPTTPNGVVQITTVAPGYREMKRSVNYKDPSASASEVGPQQEAIISFPLVKVKMGDYIEFSNVRFIPNTALLQPESKNELDGLVDLMKEYTKYKIKIHGHCNGEKKRDVVSRGTSPEFFATNTANVPENVTAKRYTELMAQVVKDYLVSQGIEEKRISTKGDGGKALLYPTNSTLAIRNDRVEIEVSKK